jgi:hypothetical protein
VTDPVRVPPVHVPPGVEALIRALAGGAGEERDQRASTFARGLALGALVGAAIAGSTIWQRRTGRVGARVAGHAETPQLSKRSKPSEPSDPAPQEPLVPPRALDSSPGASGVHTEHETPFEGPRQR